MRQFDRAGHPRFAASSDVSARGHALESVLHEFMAHRLTVCTPAACSHTAAQQEGMLCMAGTRTLLTPLPVSCAQCDLAGPPGGMAYRSSTVALIAAACCRPIWLVKLLSVVKQRSRVLYTVYACQQQCKLTGSRHRAPSCCCCSACVPLQRATFLSIWPRQPIQIMATAGRPSRIQTLKLCNLDRSSNDIYV